MHYTAILRHPAPTFATGITTASLGYPIIEVEMSEFRKMDGGLTCLSLVFD